MSGIRPLILKLGYLYKRAIYNRVLSKHVHCTLYSVRRTRIGVPIGQSDGLRNIPGLDTRLVMQWRAELMR